MGKSHIPVEDQHGKCITMDAPWTATVFPKICPPFNEKIEFFGGSGRWGGWGDYISAYITMVSWPWIAEGWRRQRGKLNGQHVNVLVSLGVQTACKSHGYCKNNGDRKSMKALPIQRISYCLFALECFRSSSYILFFQGNIQHFLELPTIQACFGWSLALLRRRGRVHHTLLVAEGRGLVLDTLLSRQCPPVRCKSYQHFVIKINIEQQNHAGRIVLVSCDWNLVLEVEASSWLETSAVWSLKEQEFHRSSFWQLEHQEIINLAV